MQLAIVVGIVVFIVRLVSKRGESGAEREGTGTSLRRFFVYVIMLVTLLLAGLGVAGLIEAAALESSGSAARDTASIRRRNIAFVVVALPVFVGLAFYTRRRSTDDPAERRSLGWAFYVTVALLGSLLLQRCPS